MNTKMQPRTLTNCPGLLSVFLYNYVCCLFFLILAVSADKENHDDYHDQR